jgi:DNA-binding response OmpR family regulator
MPGRQRSTIMSGKTIWIVDDETNIRELIRRYLKKEGYQVRLFASAEELERALVGGVPDMFILDIMLPGSDGLTLCRKIRETYDLPIIFVSARGEEFDRVLGLELGGDDYLAKPFSPRELVVRITNIFKRYRPPAGEPHNLSFKNMTVYPEQRKITINSEETSFTGKEYELLYLLASSPNRPFSRKQLLDQIWGYDFEGEERAVDDAVKRIRKKMRQKGALPQLTTVWGYGYKLNV